MNPRLPFVGRIFWKVLAVVVVLVVLAWWLYIRLSEYELGPQDYVGTIICTVLFAYLVHLWLLPTESPPEEESELDEEPPSQET